MEYKMLYQIGYLIPNNTQYIGSIAGIKIYTDDSMPDNEIRFKSGNETKIIKVQNDTQTRQ